MCVCSCGYITFELFTMATHRFTSRFCTSIQYLKQSMGECLKMCNEPTHKRICSLLRGHHFPIPLGRDLNERVPTLLYKLFKSKFSAIPVDCVCMHSVVENVTSIQNYQYIVMIISN